MIKTAPLRAILALFGAFALFASVSPALASDLGGYPDSAKDAPGSLRSWTGVYAGVGFGVMSASVTRSDDGSYVYYDDPARTTAVGYDTWSNSDKLGADGVFGTVQIGGDYQFPHSRFFAGAFADIDWSNAEGASKSSSSYAYGDGGSGAEARTGKWRIDDQWAIGARVGVLVSDNTALYALAAYTQADGGVKLSGTGAPTFPDGLAEHDFTADGWAVGAGAEFRLSGGLSLKTEYRYSQFSSEQIYSVSKANAAGDNWGWAQNERASLQPDTHTVRAVLVYKVGPNN